MSKDNKFDGFFREKLSGFQSQPDEQVWQRIEAELHQKKRRAIPAWWRLAGVAAALVTGIFGYEVFSDRHHPEFMPVVHVQHRHTVHQNLQQLQPKRSDAVPVGEAVANGTMKGAQQNAVPEKTDSLPAPTVDLPPVALPLQKQPHGETRIASSDDRNHKLKLRKPHHDFQGSQNHPGANQEIVAATLGNNPQGATGNQHQSNENGIAEQQLPRQDDFPVDDKTTAPENPSVADGKNMNDGGPAQSAAETKKDSTGLPAGSNTLEELLHEKEKQVTSNELKSGRWQVTTVVAPVYFSSASNGSPLDPRFEKNKKSYTPTLSFGVGAKYAVSKKLAVRAGVQALKLEYNTSDLVFAQSATARKLENVTPNLQGSMIDIDNKPLGQQAVLGRAQSEYEGQVSQRIGYVEIPVELSYKLLDRKFGVELIGGLSTLVLNDNQVVLLSDGLQMPIGEADNLASVHVSSNFGLGLHYNFLKSFQASVEPMLKYQFGTFSDNAGNFKPYFFGLYTGLSYRF